MDSILFLGEGIGQNKCQDGQLSQGLTPVEYFIGFMHI